MSAAFCPSCGTARPEGAAFCPNCGHRFADASAPAPPVSAPLPVASAPPALDPDATVRIDPEATVRVVPEAPPPAPPPDPEATIRVDPDATIRSAPEAPPPAPPIAPIPPVGTPPASGDATLFVPPEDLPRPVAPIAPLGASPSPQRPMTREERRALRRQRRAQGTPREVTQPIAPVAPLAASGPSGATPIEPLAPSGRAPGGGWDAPAMPRGGLPKAARIGLFGVAGVVAVVALLALVLVLGTGTIEANAAPWLRQQAATIPGQMAYDDIEAHPVRGVMTLTNVRYSENGAAEIGDSDLMAERVDIEMPRAFFFGALAGRLPELQSGQPVEAIDMTASNVTAFDFRDEVAMRVEEVSVSFDGLFAPEVYEVGFDVASDQSGRIVLRGITSPEVSREFPTGVPTTIDEMVFDARWDAGSGEFEVREATFEAGDIEASGDGQMTVAPTILARLQVGDFRGAEDLVESGIVPVTAVRYDARMASGSALSFPMDDEGTFEIGSFSMSATADASVGGENATWQTADLRTSGSMEGEVEGMRLVLYPEAASRFNARQGAELGITADQLAEPMSARLELRQDDNRVTIRRAEADTGLGRLRASGALEVDPRDPEAAFFAEPFELRLDRLPPALSSQLSRLFNESSFPGFQRDGDAFVVRLEGAIRDLQRQF
ncbi:MAG: zinc-ribbon domain-containing protein [Bacteroidota bacterium]